MQWILKVGRSKLIFHCCCKPYFCTLELISRLWTSGQFSEATFVKTVSSSQDLAGIPKRHVVGGFVCLSSGGTQNRVFKGLKMIWAICDKNSAVHIK